MIVAGTHYNPNCNCEGCSIVNKHRKIINHMPQDKTIKGVMERFRGIFSGDLGHIKAWDKDGKVVNIEDIEQFIQQEIKDALESVVPETIYDEIEIENQSTGEIKILKTPLSKRAEGFNQAIEQINQNIKHYIE